MNRNFGYQWGGSGVLGNPCDLNYAGPGPFSEPETRAIRDFVTPIADKFDMYIALHSFMQFLLNPGGILPEHQPAFTAVTNALIASQAANNATYRGSIGVTAGADMGWAYHAANIPLAYLLEFEPELTSEYIFFLPNDRIRRNCERFVDSMAAMIRAGQEYGLFQYEPISWQDIVCKIVPKLC